MNHVVNVAGMPGGISRRGFLGAINGLYPKAHANFAKGVVATIAAGKFPEGAVSVRVTPLDSYGNRGKPLEATLPS